MTSTNVTQIKNARGDVLFEFAGSLAEAVAQAAVDGVSLSDANLLGASLSGAKLHYADLYDANLNDAKLSNAYLTDANLSYADMGYADLSNADLRNADLTGANLHCANLSYADLTGANLTGANLTGADLRQFRDDIWSVLCSAPAEVPALRSAIIEGRIDGSCYEGECACLVGTLANARHCRYDEIDGLEPDGSRLSEVFFAAIKQGDTPETSQFSANALRWVDEWLANIRGAIPALQENQDAE